ncbi:MAG: damage-control phosphatase ARMT1 family protein [Thermoguttaceae bacterium]
MPASLDCMLCLMRQSLEARFASTDEGVHRRVMRHVVDLVSERGFDENPPRLAQLIQRVIRREANDADPYRHVKAEFNRLMLSRLDNYRKQIADAHDPLEMAVRFAVAGNTIDYAVRGDWTPALVDEVISQTLAQPMSGTWETFVRNINAAQRIFYITDNAGEIVCDRLLIEELLREGKDVVAGVRGAPVLNDATMQDARDVGITGIVRVVDNGNDGLGTMLDECSQPFLDALAASDLVISKGLANYETLIVADQEALPKTVAYLFKAKCQFIASYSGYKLGSLVVHVVERKNHA